jgi:hypothetical protein
MRNLLDDCLMIGRHLLAALGRHQADPGQARGL